MLQELSDSGSTFSGDMLPDEMLKAVFPLLEGTDLAACMSVCKQWHQMAQDDYFWKCLCAKRWPSTCKNPSPPITYHKLFKTFHKREHHKTLLPPRISLSDLEFYIDIWADDDLLFSQVVAGPVLWKGNQTSPPGICKMTLPVEPRFAVPDTRTICVSVLVARKDSNKVACIINKSIFDYIDRSSFRALAFDYLMFSPVYPFVAGIRAWISLLFMEHANENVFDVFGIEIDFCDAANSEDEVLWLLDMLDWK
ncbi:hypothetical protein E3N88_30216 [Mikania micrantha]|uniref:F-box domain-containing protein n=1 Tax=Mikania micrantha TaxID=192012 RepID=A0A5N6MLF4_9ASTR|nr:hypothetical protein E3N88_30216 [Mikania micrantha]